MNEIEKDIDEIKKDIDDLEKEFGKNKHIDDMREIVDKFGGPEDLCFQMFKFVMLKIEQLNDDIEKRRLSSNLQSKCQLSE